MTSAHPAAGATVMTFFLNPLVGSSTGSTTWNQLQRQPGNSISIGATSGRTSESGMQPITNWFRQLAAGDRVDLDQEYQISGAAAAAAAAHHEMIELQSNVARKELDRYLQQEATCDITAAGDVHLYHYHDDPFALAMSTLARKYNYARSTAAAAAGSLVQTSTGASVLPGQCDVDQLPSSEFHDQLEDGEDFMITLNPADLLLGILTPPPRTLDHTKSFESFTAANLHEESTRMSEESGLRSTVIAGDHTTSASLFSTAGHEGSGTAKGFHLSSMEIDCSYSSADDGDDDDERPIAIVQQDPAETRSPHGILPAAHDGVKKSSTGSLQQAKFKSMTVLAKRLKLSLGDKLEDTLLEKIKDATAKASVAGYNRKSAAAGRHGNLEQQQQESSGCMSHGELQQPGSTADDVIDSVLDSTHDQGLHEERYDGPTTAGQGSGIISEAHEVAEDARDARQSRSRLHQNPITLKQSSDLQSLHSTSKSPFRIRKIGFPEIVAMGPPPSQALPRPRVGGARGAASYKRAHHQSKAAPEQSPAAAPQLQSPHLQHATSFLDAQSPSASHQFSQAAAAAFVGSRSTVSSCKPLDVEAAQADKNEARTRSEAIRSYLEINQLKTQQQLMNMTEPRQLIKPRSEQQAVAAAAVSLVKPIKASPRRPPLHMTEDALLPAVSKSAVAAKRSNTDEYPWSKKQRAAILTTEPARDHQQHVKLLPECKGLDNFSATI